MIDMGNRAVKPLYYIVYKSEKTDYMSGCAVWSWKNIM